MAPDTATTAGPDAPDVRPAITKAARPPWTELWPLLALYLFAAVTYILLGRLVALPIIAPDEYTYGHLARSLADGDGLSWGGAPFPVRSALYLYLIAPFWTLDSQLSSYEWAKLFGAVCATAVVLPTWLLARRFTGPRMALIPAALSVTGAWMTFTGLIATENVAYPLAVAALAAIVPAVAKPGWRWGLAALVLAGLATWSRSQLVVLPVILLVALIVDAARHGSGWRARLAEHRTIAAVTTAILATGGLVVLVSSSALGRYSGLTSSPVPLDRFVDGSRDQVAALLVLAGLLPVVVALAGSLRRDVWRDPVIAPLLTVTWSAAVVLLVQSGLALAVWDTGWSIERYVVYCIPLLLVAMVTLLERGLVDWRRLAIVTAGAVVLALLIPGTRSYIEEPALFGLSRRMEALLGVSTAVGVTIALVLLAGLTALAIRRLAARPQVVACIVALLTGAVLVVQGQSTWAHRDAATSYWRAGFPANLSWIDERVGGSMAHFVVFAPAFRHPVTEFFNRGIIRTYAFDQYPQSRGGTIGRVCSWSLGASGAVSFQPSCGPAPTRLLINDEAVKVTFHEQRVLANEREVGRVIAIPARVPRLLALVTPSCATTLPIVDNDGDGVGRLRKAVPLQCNPTFGATLYLDAPATLVATFRGGTVPSVVALEGRQASVKPGAVVRLRTRRPAGPSQASLAVQPSGPPPENPQLISLELVRDGRSTQLLY